MNLYPKLPDYVSFPKPNPRSTPRTLRNTQTTNVERRVSLAADSAVIPIAYGRIRKAPLIGAVTSANDNLIIQAIWCMGEIGTIEQVYINGEEPVDVAIQTYTGTTIQEVDSTLNSAIADYSDTLVAITPGGAIGVAYSVISIGSTSNTGWPRIEAIIQGRKVYDPRSDSVVYSTNPALMLADYLSDDKIGMGLTIDWSSVTTTANVCDETLSDSSKRREAGILIDQVAESTRHAEILATYAGCIIVNSDSGIKLVPNRPVSVSRALTSEHIVAGSLKLSRPSKEDTPTVVEVSYTNTSSSTEWRDDTAKVEAEGVSTGLLPRRVSRVSLPGIQSYAQAYREATERLNEYTLQDLMATWVTTDEALQDEAGDVVTVTHPLGLSAKKFRLLEIKALEPGRWQVTAKEYDEAVYSDEVRSTPTYVDTSLPSPLSPPTPNTPTIAEELFTDETGTTYSRMRVTWTGSSWPYARQYRVVVTGASVIIDTLVAARGTSSHTVVTPPVTQDVSYTAEIYIVSSVGAVSETPSSNTATAVGKYLKPTDVSSISGFEAGQFVALTWSHATDIDLRGYIVKRLPAANYTDGGASNWEHANAETIVERVDATSYLAFSQPVGDFYYGVKALDSVGNESSAAAWAMITITADTAGTGVTTLRSGEITVKMEDAIPTGATASTATTNNQAPTFVTSPKYSGTHSLRVTKVAGDYSQAYWISDPDPVYVHRGDTLFAYVYLDVTDTPSTVMLQWNSNSKGWAHRAYWGANNFTWGENNTAERYPMGNLPSAGQWVRLAVPAALVGLEGEVVNGFAFTVYDGAANFDYAGVGTDGGLTNCHVYTLPGVSGSFAITAGGETWADRFGASGTAWNVGGTTGKLWAQEHGTLVGGFVWGSAHWDTLVDRVANWAWSATVTEYGAASASKYTALAAAADYPTFTDVGGTSANRSARYMKAKVTAACSGADDAILVELPITASRQGKVITQTGTETVGTSGVTVTFDPAYSEIPSISLVAEYDMATRAYAVADNITATSFDIYLIDWTGTLCSGTAHWTATGS